MFAASGRFENNGQRRDATMNQDIHLTSSRSTAAFA
jgi:hypothetical protein